MIDRAIHLYPSARADRTPRGWWAITYEHASTRQGLPDLLALRGADAHWLLPPEVPCAILWRPPQDRPRLSLSYAEVAVLILPAAWAEVIAETARQLDPRMAREVRMTVADAASIALRWRDSGALPLAAAAIMARQRSDSTPDTMDRPAPLACAVHALLPRWSLHRDLPPMALIQVTSGLVPL